MGALRLPVEGRARPRVRSRRGSAVVHGTVRARQPDLFVAEHDRLAGLREGRAGCTGPLAGETRDPWRDAEPGKIMHELRYGELAHFHLISHTPYYGTADATPLYLSRCTPPGKRPATAPCWRRICRTPRPRCAGSTKKATATAICFRNIEKRTRDGYENMDWKDAGDSMTWPDGSLVRGPKALCELQGYVYDAWRRMAEVFEVLGDPNAPRRYAKRRRPVRKFNAVFWNEELGFYAYCWMAKSGRCQPSPPTPDTCYGPESFRRTARAASYAQADGAEHEYRLAASVRCRARQARIIHTPTRTDRSGRTTTV